MDTTSGVRSLSFWLSSSSIRAVPVRLVYMRGPRRLVSLLSHREIDKQRPDAAGLERGVHVGLTVKSFTRVHSLDQFPLGRLALMSVVEGLGVMRNRPFFLLAHLGQCFLSLVSFPLRLHAVCRNQQ